MKANTVDGFDRLAFIYDPLARMIYGQSIVRAQTCFLDMITTGSKVLIIGGGTGWLLAELLNSHPTCEVWYIESSANMLWRAVKKNGSRRQVHFILGTDQDIPNSGFDIVITHFFLDLFSPVSLRAVVRRIAQAARPGALWIVSDFVNQGKWWQGFLLRTMYSFFRYTCHIEAVRLPGWEEVLLESGLTKVRLLSYYRGFIESAVYRLEVLVPSLEVRKLTQD